MKSVLTFIITLIIFLSLAHINLTFATSSDPIVTLVNQQRLAQGLQPLMENSTLASSAQNKACDMNKKNYWSHTDPEGRPFYYWISQSGYSFKFAGENLAKDMSSDAATVQAWLDSPTHRQNIMSSSFKEVGIGRCGKYIVQHFGGKRESSKAQLSTISKKLSSVMLAIKG